MKGSKKTWGSTRHESETQNRRSHATVVETGRFKFQREAISSMENMGDKRLRTWKECWLWD